VLAQAAALTSGVVRGPGQPALRLEPPAAAGGGAARPFAHPRYWAAFIIVGDPN
jgi:CHAT domain-containing protein